MYILGFVAAVGLGICIGLILAAIREEDERRRMLASCKRVTFQMGVDGVPKGWTDGRADVTRMVGRN